MIRKCSCRNEFQDRTYGLFMRVMNWARKKGVWRCTVCVKEHHPSNQE